ncbi:MAG: EamA family transporter [Clostridiales bacterium]|nr:EamA family transporter [Clostridiales bacterium]
MNRLKLILVMVLWGSLGVFTKSVPLSALHLAFLRALIALPVLFLAMRLKKASQPAPWKRYIPYMISGALLGFGWLTLFFGYKLTSISSAVISYNMCPVYVMVAAPLILKERILKSQIAVILASFTGLFLIVGYNFLQGYGMAGILLSALSGMIYAAIVLLNRGIKQRIDSRTATFVQILTAMLVLLPFVLLNGNLEQMVRMDLKAITLTVLLGVLHTGVAYTLFFSVCEQMKSVEIATYSYFEPLCGIMFGVTFLGECLSAVQIAGGVLILGSTYIGEMLKNRLAAKACKAAEAADTEA